MVSLLAFRLIDNPVLDFTSFSSDEHVVSIDLIKTGWLVGDVESLHESLSPHLKVNDCKVDETLVVVGNSKSSC